MLYLHGLSTRDFVPCLEDFFGSAAGFSASVITRLTESFQAELGAFMARDLSLTDWEAGEPMASGAQLAATR